jgi:putative membrane protein
VPALARSFRAHRFALCLVLVALAVPACDRLEYRGFPPAALDARSGAPGQFRDPRTADAQRDFLALVAQASLFEIEASRVALVRGGSKAVRRFAETTLRDCIAIDTDLEQLAGSVGVALPTRLSDELHARLSVLERLSGSEFDRAYARNVGVLVQEEALAAFERAANDSGERVQRFAAAQLPALRDHLQEGRKLASEVDRANMASDGARSLG